MGQARHRTAAMESRTVRVVLRLALVTLPAQALRALFVPREHPASLLNDRQLADIGLTRADVSPPRGRPSVAELEIERLLRGRDWR